MRGLFCILTALMCLLSAAVSAHEVRPGYLELTEGSDGAVHVLWKEPAGSAYINALTPRIIAADSTDWLAIPPRRAYRNDTFFAREWDLPAPRAPLSGTVVEIAGLERTITDVLVRIVYADGVELTRLLKPDAASVEIPGARKVAPPVREYVQLGFTHIWEGIDHLLYVLGLMLLVRNLRTLVKTITGFTIAHSITLAAAALGYVDIPPAPVEAVISLSIVYIAVELVHVRRGRPSLASRAPWVVAFAFGLLHGLGFAGALAEVGLPAHAIPTALLLFNIGIELGQLTFVALALLLFTVLVRAAPVLVRRAEWLPPYAIGSLASFWLIERIGAFL